MNRPLRTPLALGLLLLLAPASAMAGDFLDTRISFTLGDDNFFKDAGQQVPDSPLIGIGDRPGYELPYDNLNAATTGRENQLHLVLYKKVDGILPGLTTEAAATMEIDLAELELADAEVDRVFSDDSSYIRLAYALDRARKGDSYLDLVLFPLSGDRFRVGYLYDLTWGGENIFPRKRGPTPAFKLGGEHGRVYWWAGMKMVLAQTEITESTNEQGTVQETSENETLYGVLAGVGYEPIDGLSVDLSGGHIQMAWNPISDVAGEPVTATGFSARLAYGRGLKVGLSSDLRLVRNDREYLEALSRRPVYKPGEGLSWSVSAEGNAIAQVLADPDLAEATKRQWASAVALQMRLQYDYLRVNLTGVYRSLEFALLNTPSLTPFTGLSETADSDPQMFAAASADYHFPGVALTPGIQIGVETPAAVTTELFARAVGSEASPTLVGRRTLLIRSTGERVILPEDESRVPVASGRLSLTWYPSDILTLVGFVILTVDNNATTLVLNPDLTRSRTFDDAFRLGAGVTAQARF